MDRARALIAALLVSLAFAVRASAQSRVQLESPSLDALRRQSGGEAAQIPEAQGSERIDPELLKQLGLSPEDIERLEGVATLLKQEWVDGDSLTSARLRDGAIRGMIKELDPHSEFYTPREFEQFKQALSGTYAGIGAMMLPKEKGDVQRIQLCYPGSPAEKAGVKAGDAVLEIDGQDVGPMTGDEVVNKIHGEPGTRVTLKLARVVDPKRPPKILTTAIARAEVSVPNLFTEVLGGGVGYIYFSEFRDKDTEFAFEKAVRALASKGVSKLVIDERGNPGGSVNTAVKIANLFLDKGQKIVTMKNRRGGERIAYAPADGPFKSLALRVIIDGGSASASEILAGALQDNRKARVVGSQSFGKGSAQALIPIKDVGVVKLTINKWYTPSGKSIQGDEGGLKPGVGSRGGITPDDPVTVSDQDEAKVMAKIVAKLLGVGDVPAVADAALKKALE